MLTLKRCLTWLTLAVLPMTSSAYSYEVLDLTPILGASAVPKSFGNSGGLLVERNNQNLYWRAGLGLTQIPNPAGGFVVRVNGVNAHDEVAGVFQTSVNGDRRQTTFLWNPTSGFQLIGPDLDAVDNYMQVRGVTDAGDVLVDYFGMGNNPRRGYVLHRDGTARPLVAPVGLNVERLVGLNASGDIIGVTRAAFGSDPTERAIGWNVAENFLDYGSLGVDSRPVTVNADGTVLLTGSDIWSQQHHYIQRRDGMRLFTGLVRAGDLNDSEAVVGLRYEGNVPRGVVWRHDTGGINLDSLIDPSSGWQIQDASFINDSGQIVAWATRGGTSGYVLLSPVPEPSTLACLLIGAAALARKRRKRA